MMITPKIEISSNFQISYSEYSNSKKKSFPVVLQITLDKQLLFLIIKTICSAEYQSSQYRNADLTILAVGEIIIAKCRDGRWYRGKVTDADPDNKRVKVNNYNHILVHSKLHA